MGKTNGAGIVETEVTARMTPEMLTCREIGRHDFGSFTDHVSRAVERLTAGGVSIEVVIQCSRGCGVEAHIEYALPSLERFRTLRYPPKDASGSQYLIPEEFRGTGERLNGQDVRRALFARAFNAPRRNGRR